MGKVPQKQEVPPVLSQRTRLFCDYQLQSVDIVEFQHTSEMKITEIGRVITGELPGRTNASTIKVFDSSGTAVQDLFVASRLLDLSNANTQHYWVKTLYCTVPVSSRARIYFTCSP
ncbi:hypothetical protein [Grimontia sp. NTOU-MAR1]|uniref:hypothetical protein n=1 Tax=Grimontia sp. NTOU-MAR1 TaxID=3111011 RepID=UPI002DB8EA82|nr:hypothetical protein [Grimontia sp. NTOU-MAR1]WRV97921.1 hypothetical protein VP504_00335 [Grimontia sp. NTOU-MAR1]